MIEHAALVNYIWWAKDVYLGGESLDFPLYSSLAFDLTVTSIFTPLLQGGKVLIYDKAGSDFPIMRILDEDEVDVLKLTPSHFALMEGRDNSHSRIKRLIVGGEALETTLARRIRESFGGTRRDHQRVRPDRGNGRLHDSPFRCRSRRTCCCTHRCAAANVQIYVLDGTCVRSRRMSWASSTSVVRD